MDKLKLNELYGMDNGTFANAIVDINEVIASYEVITTTLNVKTVQFNDLVTKLQNSLIAAKGSSFTKLVHEADRLRDLAHSGLTSYVLAYTKCSVPNKKTAANKIFHTIKQFGLSDLREASLNKETALLDALLVDLQADKIATELAALPELSFWINELQTTVGNFKSVKADKFDESAAKLDYTTTSVRKEIMPCFSQLGSALEGLAAAMVDAAYPECVKKINTIILNK